MSVFIYPSSGAAGAVSLGRLALTDLGTATYTTNGAKSLGGLSFTLDGVDGTNTFDVGATGAAAVGGTTQQVIMTFDPATHFGFTMTVGKVVGCTIEYDDGTITGSDNIGFYVGDDSLNRVGMQRNVTNIVRVGAMFSGAFKTNQDSSVANAVDVVAMGFVLAGQVLSGWYDTTPPGSAQPTTYANKVKSNGELGSVTFFDLTYCRVSWVGARGKRVEAIEFWDYTP